MTVLTSPEFIELQTALAGRFSIERELGRGGMGVVFLARDVRLERHVAIKLLAPALAARPEMRRRFLREARIAAQCFHPHIVPIHAVEEHAQLAWFVMSYVRGESLAQRIARLGAQPPEFVERIGREVGWALAYAHDRGVVHRDVKPENILLEQGTDRCLLADFGIALHETLEQTPRTGEVAGTASYMAPEQALGENLDGRADLYALGVMLFVAATGRHPFGGTSSMALLVQHALEPAPPVQTLAPTLAPALADAIDRCLAKRPHDRFAHAHEFVAAIERGRAPVPISRSVVPVQTGARAAGALAGWSAATSVATTLLMLGEGTGFGRDIVSALGFSIAVLLGAASAIRLTETLVAARRAAREGAASTDLVRALVGENEGQIRRAADRARFATMAVGGAALGLAQGMLTDLAIALPDAATSLLQVALLTLPAFLIGRGVHGASRDSKVTGWMRAQVFTPVARKIAQLFHAAPATPHEEDARLANAHTEVVLDAAAHELLAALPSNVRSGLAALPHAIESLARDADRFRGADRALADAERAARAAGHDVGEPELLEIAAQRDVVRQRLSTTIAALEAIRLDLMRLAAGAVDASHLTTHLQVARDLEHRLAADEEVRVLLARPLPAGAST